MNKDLKWWINWISRPSVMEEMRKYTKEYNSILVRYRHVDEYLAKTIHYDVFDGLWIRTGEFYRHRHHRYFKRGKPRKLRKAK